MKGLSVTLLILMFFTFLLYEKQKSNTFQVLEVTTPTQIIIDLNHNNKKDANETIELTEIESFCAKPNDEQSKKAIQLGVSKETLSGLGFLAEKFARDTLEAKKVEYKNSKILINNKNYQNMLLERGLALEKDKPPCEQFKKNLKIVQNLNPVIFNNKSHKYHKLDCKYGLLAHNSQIIPASQLPKDAKACKFCHCKNQEKSKNKQKTKIHLVYKEELVNIKSPETKLFTQNTKIFLTDFTRTLKPSNSCVTSLCKAIVGEVNSAQSSIDMAIYGYTKIPELQKALENAQKKGVKIRFIYDLDKNGQNIYPDTIYLSKILTNNSHDTTQHLMHDKFFVIDNRIVITGSANISNTDMSGFNSNAVMIINSSEVAKVYKEEFEQMYSGNFQKSKQKIKNKEFGNLSIYFSPKDKGINAIVSLINKSQKYIYIPAFLITHKELTEALISAHNRGIAVKIILDSTNTHTSASKMKQLRENKIPVKTENLAGKLHSKSIIIDDLYTIIGSMNFSRSGEGLNDENFIIIKDSDITRFYKNFFLYLWARIPDKWLKLNARAESPDSIGSCSDGIDNDFDGKIDMTDDSCKPTVYKKYALK